MSELFIYFDVVGNGKTKPHYVNLRWLHCTWVLMDSNRNVLLEETDTLQRKLQMEKCKQEPFMTATSAKCLWRGQDTRKVDHSISIEFPGKLRNRPT